MIDKQDPQLGLGHGEQSSVVPSTAASPLQNTVGQTELFGELFVPTSESPSQSNLNRDGLSAVVRSVSNPVNPFNDAAVDLAPVSPESLLQSGLTLMDVCDLILKQLHLQRGLLGIELAKNARLPFHVIDDGLCFLKDQKCIEVSSGDLVGRISYRFNLTELGGMRAREALDRCRYVGPAPVPLSSYVEQCRKQTVAAVECNLDDLDRSFRHLIVRPSLLQELGPAVCSGQAIFLHGPPGNGKTRIARGLGDFLNRNGGDIYVPYAIQAENSIITVFDPTFHQTTDEVELEATGRTGERSGRSQSPSGIASTVTYDPRWRRIRRPVVICGGELTLEMLDLRFNTNSNFYQAPLHIKANGGVFLIDDFGRQLVNPRDLLNRWFLPLEERIDFLTLETGKKFSVPFEQLIIFSTNLDPRELVDEAFLRRIRHKIHINTPSRDLFTDIFKLVCHEKQIPFNPIVVEFLFSNYYDQGKSPRSSDPRDLLEIGQAICRFRKQTISLTQNLIKEAAERFFCQV